MNRKREEALRGREDAWNRGLNQACWHSRKSEYNALYDTNMRHFFENEQLQLHLYRAGLVRGTTEPAYDLLAAILD